MTNLNDLVDNDSTALQVFGGIIGFAADLSGAAGFVQLLFPPKDPVATALAQINTTLGEIDAQLKIDELESKWTAFDSALLTSNTAYGNRANFFDTQGNPTVAPGQLITWLEELSSGIVYFTGDNNIWGIARNVIPSDVPHNYGPLIPISTQHVDVPPPPSGMDPALDFFWPLPIGPFLATVTRYVIGSTAASMVHHPASVAIYRSAYTQLQWLYEAVVSEVICFPYGWVDTSGWALAHDPASANVYYVADLYGRGITSGGYPYSPVLNGQPPGGSGQAPASPAFDHAQRKLRLAQVWCLQRLLRRNGLFHILDVIQELRGLAGDPRYDAGRGPSLRDAANPGSSPALPPSLAYGGLSLADLYAVAFSGKRTGALSQLRHFITTADPPTHAAAGLLELIAPPPPGGWPTDWTWGIE